MHACLGFAVGCNMFQVGIVLVLGFLCLVSDQTCMLCLVSGQTFMLCAISSHFGLMEEDVESDVTLPDNVQGSSEESDSNVTLPDAIEEQCCSANCMTLINDDASASSALTALHSTLSSAMSLSEKNMIAWNCMVADGNGKGESLRFAGIDVCMTALQRCMHIKSPKKLRCFLGHARDGHTIPPPDGRQARQSQSCEKFLEMDVFFQYAYNALAEWLPDAPEDQGVHASRGFPQLPQPEKGCTQTVLLDWEAAKSASSAAVESFNVIRHLPAMSMARLFSLAQGRGVQGCLSTFKRCYTTNWARTLRFRRETEFGACIDCTKLKLARIEANTPEELARANTAYKQHLEHMFLDRVVDSRLCELSRVAFSEMVDPTLSVAS